MAYLIPISIFKCRSCGLRATHELYNGYNSLIGYFCKKDGERLLEKQKKDEGQM